MGPGDAWLAKEAERRKAAGMLPRLQESLQNTYRFQQEDAARKEHNRERLEAERRRQKEQADAYWTSVNTRRKSEREANAGPGRREDTSALAVFAIFEAVDGGAFDGGGGSFGGGGASGSF